MSILDSLFHPRLILGLLAYLIIGAGLGYLEFRLQPRSPEHRILQWLLERLFLPLAEVAALVTFLIIAYPALFGIEPAPAIGGLLTSGEKRLTDLVNLLFVAALLLPLVPVFNRFPGSVVLVQAMLATAVFFHWLAEHYGIAPAYRPSLWTAGLILVWTWLAHRLHGRLTDHALSNRHSRVQHHLFWQLAGALQMPSILVYARELGSQLH